MKARRWLRPGSSLPLERVAFTRVTPDAISACHLRRGNSVTAPSRPRANARQEFLPFAPPLIGEEEINEVVATLRSGWITTGPKTKRFETNLAAYLGASGALALNSCTAALHTALVTLGVGPGDEVITTPLTFAASVQPLASTVGFSFLK